VKKIVACLSIIVIGLILVPGPSAVDAAAKVSEIGITYVKLPLNVPAILAKRLGFFEKEFGRDGITIQRPEMNTGSQQMQALAAGSIQFASVLGSDSAVLARANGVDLKVIATFSRAPGAFTVMAKNPAIRKMTDLKGKIIVGPKGTVLHHLLVAALKREGLTAGDVKFVNMTVPQAQAALISDSADAALIAGSFLVPAEAAGARVIVNGNGLVSGLTVVAVSNAFLKDHPDLVKRYLKVHNQALEHMRKNPAETIRIVAEETQIAETDVKKMLPRYDFNSKVTARDIADLAATQTFLKENDMLADTIDIKDMIGIIR
jgi:sulfonate transport system substrate-binding protein